MLRSIALLCAVTFTVVLTGCASPSAPAPLSRKTVDISLSTSVPGDTLIGDSVHLTAIVTLAHKRTDKVQLTIEKSSDGTTWSTLATKKARGPEVQLVADEKTSEAGEVSYRSVVRAGTKSKIVANTLASQVKTEDIKQLVRKFFYDRTQAYKSSSKAGVRWDVAHDSSIYDRSAKSWRSGVAGSIRDRYIETTVPDLSTIAVDTDWLLHRSSCNPTMKNQPDGRTFVVTVESGGSADGFPFTPSKADVHVTYSDGKLVDYVQMCVK